MKSYTVTAAEEETLGPIGKRAVMADAMARVLWAFDQDLRKVAKWQEGPAGTFAEEWREHLRDLMRDEGICLDDITD